MSTAAYLDVFGAPSAQAVAAELGAALAVPPVREGVTGTGETWFIASPEWRVDIYEQHGIDLLPGEGDVWVSVHHTDPTPAPLHRLTDRLFRHLVNSTGWGITAESEADGFPARSRTAAAA